MQFTINNQEQAVWCTANVTRCTGALGPTYAAILAKNHIPNMSPPVRCRHGSMWLFLFPKIQNTLKGKQFAEVEAIKLNTTHQVFEIPNTENEPCFH